MWSVLGDGRCERLGWCGRQREGLRQGSVEQQRAVGGDHGGGARARLCSLMGREWRGRLERVVGREVGGQRGSGSMELVEDMGRGNGVCHGRRQRARMAATAQSRPVTLYAGQAGETGARRRGCTIWRPGTKRSSSAVGLEQRPRVGSGKSSQDGGDDGDERWRWRWR